MAKKKIPESTYRGSRRGSAAITLFYINVGLQLSLSLGTSHQEGVQPRGINILQLLFWKHSQSFADQYEEKHAIIYGRFRILIKITPSQRRYARSCAIR